MSENQNTSTENSIDPQKLSDLVKDLNIASRNSRSYPKGHPVIEVSIAKTINSYNNLLMQHNSIVIGIAKDALMLGDTALDKKTGIFGDFAKQLYERGIVALHLNPGIKPHELANFNIILNLKREDILKQGGISSLWEKAGIVSIGITPISYENFSTTEVDAISADTPRQAAFNLWEDFIRKLIHKGASGHNPDDEEDDMDPELLASIINRQFINSNKEMLPGFSVALKAFDKATPASDTMANATYDKLSRFVNKLNPELRRQFLSISFDIKNLAGLTIAEEIMPRLDDESVIETMNDVSNDRLNAPPAILGLIKKLGMHAKDRAYEYAAKMHEEAEIKNKIHNIFLEHDSENFTPESYQSILDRIVTTDNTLRIEQGVLAGLMSTLESEAVENHISDIIMCMLHNTDDEELLSMLIGNLSEVYSFILQTGDYEQLLKLIAQCDSMPLPAPVRERLRASYVAYECLDEMLVGLHTWGKPKYEIIARLIKAVGPPFIDALLDRLAIEESLSLRRFLMDRVQDFGPAAREAIIARMSDKRWFVLRNLIIMVRAFNDSSVLEHIRPLIHNSNIKVRQEALRTCLHFQDPTAERQVLYDIGSSDRDTQMSAIYLAGKSRSVDVYKKLLSIVSRSGFNSAECELKSAAIKALADIGKPETVPELEKILSSSSLLNSRQLSKLKMEIVNSLQHYSREFASPVLLKLSKGNNELSDQAKAILQLLPEKQS